jgi:ATP-binding cassette subfamily F protein 2
MYIYNVLHISVNEIEEELEALTLLAKHRACTGVLASHPDSRDVHIDNLSITFHGVVLLDDTKLELNVGRRYGLIGLNGCGMCCIVLKCSPNCFIKGIVF